MGGFIHVKISDMAKSDNNRTNYLFGFTKTDTDEIEYYYTFIVPTVDIYS